MTFNKPAVRPRCPATIAFLNYMSRLTVFLARLIGLSLVPQGTPVVAFDAAHQQLIVEGIEQGRLGMLPPVGIPMHGNHTGEVHRADVRPPAIPVEQARGKSTISPA